MATVLDAILKINPNAEVTVNGNDLNSIEWLNGTTPIPITDIQEQIPIVEAEIEQKKQDAIDNKTSAQNKLKALGLTDAEIEAL